MVIVSVAMMMVCHVCARVYSAAYGEPRTGGRTNERNSILINPRAILTITNAQHVQPYHMTGKTRRKIQQQRVRLAAKCCRVAAIHRPGKQRIRHFSVPKDGPLLLEQIVQIATFWWSILHEVYLPYNLCRGQICFFDACYFEDVTTGQSASRP